MPDRAARRVLDAWTERLQPAEEAVARAHWAAATDATPDHQAAVEAAAKSLEERAHDEAGFSRVERSLHERIDDPVLRRAVERLRLRLLPHRIPRPERLIELEAEVQGIFARFRAVVDERRLDANEVRETLQTSRDAVTVEATWRAAAALGAELEDRVREMARLRNEHARALGFPGFHPLKLELEEVAPALLEGFLRDLEHGTESSWGDRKARLDGERAARFGVERDALRPWHLGDLFLQSLPVEGQESDPFRVRDPVELAKATFEGLGLDVQDVLARSDLLPREGKNPHAFCAHLDRTGDVRVLANVVPGERWTRTLLHELGHAVYECGLDPELPWILRRPPHACTTEGVAMLFGRLLENESWRREIAGLDADPHIARRRGEDLLAFCRWGLVMSRFEEGLYRDPDQDLDLLWWSLVERLQGVGRPPEAPRALWAAKIHVACWPAYYHAYLLGETVASLLERHVHRDVFGRTLVRNRAAGTFLRERVFAPGAAVRWERLVEEAAHAPVRADALLQDLG